MQVGNVVRFREYLEAGDDTLRFTVLELRGDNVLVTAIGVFDKWFIKPTHEYRISDLLVCE
jgi:hypothetical protein